MKYYLQAMGKYVDFGGRATRVEFWGYSGWQVSFFVLASGIHQLFLVVALVHTIPSISLSIRRLHDINMSGWWVILSFLVPFYMVIIGFIGSKDDNKYGKNLLEFQPPHNIVSIVVQIIVAFFVMAFVIIIKKGMGLI